jgi:hypothetical protein
MTAHNLPTRTPAELRSLMGGTSRLETFQYLCAAFDDFLSAQPRPKRSHAGGSPQRRPDGHLAGRSPGSLGRRGFRPHGPKRRK